MIVLVSAVARENALLRDELIAPEPQMCGHIQVTCGQLSSQSVAIATTGIGKANTAAAAALLLHQFHPDIFVMVGCGGAFKDSSLQLGDLAFASEEIYADEGVTSPQGFLDMSQLDLALATIEDRCYFNHYPVDLTTTQHACKRLKDNFSQNPNCQLGPFVTVSNCSGTDSLGLDRHERYQPIIENMEGAAAAHQCLLAHTPFMELRSVSNFVEDRDFSQWNLPQAMENAQKALLSLFELNFFSGLAL
nr:futalosine hydrolase [uncultured Desulfuromonas sp.]